MKFKDAYAKLYTRDELATKGRELTFFIANTRTETSIRLTRKQVKAMREQLDKWLNGKGANPK